MDPVDLPREIVERFDGKGMAVVGFEIDQVRRGPAGAGDGGDGAFRLGKRGGEGGWLVGW